MHLGFHRTVQGPVKLYFHMTVSIFDIQEGTVWVRRQYEKDRDGLG